VIGPVGSWTWPEVRRWLRAHRHGDSVSRMGPDRSVLVYQACERTRRLDSHTRT
jgi:hypothetical protein